MGRLVRWVVETGWCSARSESAVAMLVGDDRGSREDSTVYSCVRLQKAHRTEKRYQEEEESLRIGGEGEDGKLPSRWT